MNLERRTAVEDKIEEIKVQAFHLAPARYDDLYAENTQHHTVEGHEIVGKPVDDGDLIDRWFDTLAAQKGMTGAQVEGMYQETRRRV